MNKDQVKGVAKDIEGTIQEKVGQLTGNKSNKPKVWENKSQVMCKKVLAMQKKRLRMLLISFKY
jgi:uncharacterized protein YjbJ (UPF0337 family)